MMSNRESGKLLLVGFIRADFDVVDKIVAKVHSCGQIRRSLHDTIHQEADMMGAWQNIDCRRKAARSALTKRYVSNRIFRNTS